MSERITEAVVGQAVDLVVDVGGGIDGEPANFTIVDPDGATVAMVSGEVHQGVARVLWTVDLGERKPPVELTFTASVRGERTDGPPLTVLDGVTVHAMAWVEVDPAQDTPDGRIEQGAPAPPLKLGVPDVKAGDRLLMRIEVGDAAGGPVRQPFALALHHHAVALGAAGADQTRTLSFTPDGEAHAVLIDWTVEPVDVSTDHLFRTSGGQAPPPPAVKSFVAGAPVSSTGSGGGGSSGGLPARQLTKAQLDLTEHPPELIDRVRESRPFSADKGFDTRWWSTSVSAHYPGPRDVRTITSVDPHPSDPKRGRADVVIGDSSASPVIESRGPYLQNVIWAQEPPVILKPGVTAASTTIYGRNRYSLWAQRKAFRSPNKTTVTKTKPDGSTEKVDVWLDRGQPPGRIIAHDLSGARGVIDDLSLIATAQPTTDAVMMVDWDHGDLASATKSVLLTEYKEIIRMCHAAGIQVLAGFALVDRGVDRIARFGKWILDLSKQWRTGTDRGEDAAGANLKAMQGEIDRFVGLLVAFIDGQFPAPDHFDGINFDIEAFTPHGKELLKDKVASRAVIARFYQTVAKYFARTNRITAVTPGGMMSADAAALTSTGKLPSVKTNISPNAMPAAVLTDYRMAVGHPGLLLRPMAYDNAGWNKATDGWNIPEFNNGNGGQLEWHQAILDYALIECGVPAAQFQLGVKTGAIKKESEGGNLSDPSHVDTRCRGMLRKSRAGLCIFGLGGPLPTENWTQHAAWEKALNDGPGGKRVAAGTMAGQPTHGPLDEALLKRLKP